MFYAGYSFKMDESFSKEVSKNFINQLGSLDKISIFFNNLKIALVMFIPVIGIIMGTISGFSTGLVFNSMLDMSGGGGGGGDGVVVASYSNPLIIFLTPFGILELVSYGIAISRSGILIFEILKREFAKRSFIHLIIEIMLVSGLLFMGAIIEWILIQDSFRGIDLFMI